MGTDASRQRHLFQDAARKFRAGRLSLAELTDQFFPPDGLADLAPAPDDLVRLPARPDDCHKGDFGHVLVIAGSKAMPGAAALVGLAALRSGAGLVTVATAEPAQPVVAGFHPCLMTAGLPADDSGALTVDALPHLEKLCDRATVVAIGPGFGRSLSVRTLVRECYARIALPMVVDADGLNALAGEGIPPPKGPRVYTPHVGELKRLVGSAPRDREALEQSGRAWVRARSEAHRSVLLLKGSRTYLCDETREARNTSGSSAMASGGSGDVLTGLIAALLAQGLDGWDAARLGAFLHGSAGELAAKEIGPVGVAATDLIERLPAVIKAHGVGGRREAEGGKQEARGGR